MLKNILLFALSSYLFIYQYPAQAQKTLSLDIIYDETTFVEKQVPGFKVMKNPKHYAVLEGDSVKEINIYHIDRQKKIKSVFKNTYEIQDISHFEWSFDEQYLLIYSNPERIYRRSTLYQVHLYHIPSQQIMLLDSESILHAHFNPQNYDIAYVKNNNLYYFNFETKERQALTNDGAKNSIINGNCDWVYEEEFAFSRAFEWSENGEYLAYYKFDESEVKEFTMTFYDDHTNYPRYETFKYPKAGEDNSKVSIHIINIKNKQSFKVDEGERTDFYIPRIKWAGKQNELIVYFLNRHQNHLELLWVNPRTQESKLIYEEIDQHYIDITDNIAFDDQNGFYYTSEKAGRNQLYHWNWEKEVDLLLVPEWMEIDQIIDFDLSSQKVFFTTVGELPMKRKFQEVEVNTQQIRTLFDENGAVQVSKAGSGHFLIKSSNINKAPAYYLMSKKNFKSTLLEQNELLNQRIVEYQMNTTHFFDLEWEGVTYYGWRILPLDFDPHKKYPVIFYQYSGPGSQEVMDKFPVFQYYWHHYMAQQGYIIIAMDGKGTGGRGAKFKKQTYLNLGALETESQIAFAEILQKEWSFIDKDRMGIWGWSYGGFISASALLKGSETFKTAVSVAPVTNWAFYDNIYTERFMRTPQENPKGYEENAPEKMVDRLKGNLMLVHGVTDDNVHFQHAAVMTKNLIEAGKHFESLYYPNKNHSIPGNQTRKQLFEKITDYFKKNL